MESDGGKDLCEFSTVMHDPENAGKKLTTADARAGYESGGGLLSLMSASR